MANKPAKPIGKRTAPPTALIVSLDGLDLRFGNRGRTSPYRALLEQLLDSGKNSALKIGSLKARYSISKQARVLSWKVAFAEHEGYLYVKVDGVANGKAPAPPDGSKTAAAKRVLKALEESPLTAGEVARMLNADPATCEAVLAELVRSGSVECDGDLGKKAIYRRKGAA